MEGITRRIDELGRIVVPKEIRKALRLNVGSMVEFCVENNQMVLKKYSQLTAIMQLAETLAFGLSNSLKATVFIVSDEESIAATTGKCRSLDLSKFKSDERVGKTVELTDDKTLMARVTPIIYQGDILGRIIVVDEQILPKHIELSDFCANTLCNYYDN